VDCASSGKIAVPYFPAYVAPQGQAGSQIGIYAEDKWEMSPNIVWSYGLRYDHSTGYVGGFQISPRIDVSVWDGGKNVVHAYYGKFYAAPLLEDVRQDCVVLSAQQACSTANPVYDLKPESDSYYETGVTHSFNSQFSLSLNIFRKSVVNILDTQQLLNTPVFAVFNNSIGLDNGVEFRLQDRMLTGDEWFFTGTFPVRMRRASRDRRFSSLRIRQAFRASRSYRWRTTATPPRPRLRTHIVLEDRTNLGSRRCRPTTNVA
jgi:outer membrane receptor for ferrienterochelin and colicin